MAAEGDTIAPVRGKKALKAFSQSPYVSANDRPAFTKIRVL